MKEIVLICAVTAMVVFGYFIMKKLDAYVSSNRLSLDKKVRQPAFALLWIIL